MKVVRIAAVAYKEWREILRDRVFFAMAFVLPLTALLVLAWGLSFDVENIPFAALDEDGSATSREYLHRFIDSRYFEFAGHVERDHEILPLLARGDVRLVLVIPPKFEKDLMEARPVAVQSLIDGVFPYRTQVVRSYVAALNANFNAELLRDHLISVSGLDRETASDRVSPVRLEPRYLFNQALRSEWSMASGLIMLVLMFAPPFLTSLGVVREKENGSIYNIYASTISRGEFILGKLAPYVLISSINILVLWAVVLVVFGAPFKGNPFFFYVASVVYVTCTTGIGLLVSLWVRTQAAAALLTMVITFIPAMLYSGLMVPLESLSRESQIEARLFPAIYYLEIVWGSFLKGLAWTNLWSQLAALIVYAALLWAAAILSFRKRPRSG